ncbi:PepSY domain-containing protein [Yoonia maritima]|uniref:PepSY domain-containing protein n=1 Tax=Yoonia maritima TaxID=1435347 RepID=UPI001A9CA243|nr:PepSY domain-containing protein [Yoonia maritima]
MAEANPEIDGERIKRGSSGQYKLAFAQNNRRQERFVDPATGMFLPERKEPAIYAFMRDLHRSFTLGENGRILSAIGALAMTFLTITGFALFLRRMGGLRQMLTPIQGRGADALHSICGRVLFVPLLITAVTALWLSAVTFDIVPAGSGRAPAYPESIEELDAVAPWDLHGLQSLALADVDEVVFPIPDDWFDVWAVKTDTAYIFVDQFAGDELSRDPLPVSGLIMGYITLLHTAEGIWPWAIVLFISSLGVPFFAVTGIMVWWRNRSQGRGRIQNNASIGAAKVVILVGSEGNATWGFGKALHAAFHAHGWPVRLGAMNELRRELPTAEYLLILASTYGDGDVPKSASRFLNALARFRSNGAAHATLAFGDKAFPDFCGYAHRADAALTAKLGNPFMPVFDIDKQSAQSFRDWCGKLSDEVGVQLDVHYDPKRSKTQTLHLVRREIFGASVGATTAVLRFKAKKLPAHRPGDLVEIYPPNSTVPRLYSLGSSSHADGFLEIVVRRIEGGECSGWLCDLENGDEIEVSITRNERFQLPRRRPVVLIGAGTGIAPFTGMIRHNEPRRSVDLYWGGDTRKRTRFMQLTLMIGCRPDASKPLVRRGRAAIKVLTFKTSFAATAPVLSIVCNQAQRSWFAGAQQWPPQSATKSTFWPLKLGFRSLN